MRTAIFYIILFLMQFSAIAQVNVTGIVIDKEANEPVAGASVIVKGPGGNIKKFA